MQDRLKYLMSLVKEQGLGVFLFSVLERYAAWPQWMFFRCFEKCEPRPAVSIPGLSARDKETVLLDIIAQNKGSSFLEIGIGPVPNMKRAQLLVDCKIKYTGCDWASACEKYNLKLKAGGVRHAFEFLPNERGNYTWTLFELMRNNRTFDIIYLDGSHTFYIDLPAACLSDALLKPGGCLILDDIDWSLEDLKSMLKKDFHGWYFYRKMYNFAEYTKEQRQAFHIKMIAEDYLMPRCGYALKKDMSNPAFYVLRKPV